MGFFDRFWKKPTPPAVEQPKQQEISNSQETELSKENLIIESAVATRSSDLHPGSNEDSTINNPDKGSFAVADGAGGSRYGKLASELTVQEMAKRTQDLDESLPEEEIITELKNSITATHHAVFDKYQGEGYGTLSFVKRIGDKAYIAQVGDSRVYLKRNGKLTLLTLDDNVAHQLAKNTAEQYPDLSPNEKKEFIKNEFIRLRDKLDSFNPKNYDHQDPDSAILPTLFKYRHVITQSIGGAAEQSEDDIRNNAPLIAAPIDPTIQVITLLPGDEVIIVSDGISDNLTDAQLEEETGSDLRLPQAAERLVSESYAKQKRHLVDTEGQVMIEKVWRSSATGNVITFEDPNTGLYIQDISNLSQEQKEKILKNNVRQEVYESEASAKEGRAKPDDITAVIFRVKGANTKEEFNSEPFQFDQQSQSASRSEELPSTPESLPEQVPVVASEIKLDSPEKKSDFKSKVRNFFNAFRKTEAERNIQRSKSLRATSEEIVTEATKAAGKIALNRALKTILEGTSLDPEREPGLTKDQQQLSLLPLRKYWTSVETIMRNKLVERNEAFISGIIEKSTAKLAETLKKHSGLSEEEITQSKELLSKALAQKLIMIQDRAIDDVGTTTKQFIKSSLMPLFKTFLSDAQIRETINAIE